MGPLPVFVPAALLSKRRQDEPPLPTWAFWFSIAIVAAGLGFAAWACVQCQIEWGCLWPHN